jgi:hypothetical protein
VHKIIWKCLKFKSYRYKLLKRVHVQDK